MLTKKSTRQRDPRAPIIRSTDYAAEGAFTNDKKNIRRREMEQKKQQKKCKQSHAHNRDIRNIMDGIRGRRLYPQVSQRMVCGDMSDIPDLMTIMNRIVDGKNAFGNLPSSVREHFNNKPEKFIEMLGKKKTQADIEKLIELGVLERDIAPEPPKPQEVAIVDKEKKGASDEAEHS